MILYHEDMKNRPELLMSLYKKKLVCGCEHHPGTDGVRTIHLPTGLVSRSAEECSQFQNCFPHP